MIWRKFNGELILTPIKESVEEVLIRETSQGNKLKVCIGTDSQVKGAETEFATVIVFLREGKGGFMFIHNEKTSIKYSIKERMLMEVAKSIEIAYELCDLFTEYNIDMEVHADINTNPQFKSNVALREATG
ncbi:MAG TPA: ribonuclease H-like YkuK family protein, partial [Chitinophagaceae bacterium]|nr:ribonuclease H-like YkuK family protein [Chitinophagaceae bacterium]